MPLEKGGAKFKIQPVHMKTSGHVVGLIRKLRACRIRKYPVLQTSRFTAVDTHQRYLELVVAKQEPPRLAKLRKCVFGNRMRVTLAAVGGLVTILVVLLTSSHYKTRRSLERFVREF